MDRLRLQSMDGFTLIELSLVIIIISIISAVALLQMSPATNINLGAQANQLASDIRYTQSLSMNKDQRYYLSKTSSNTYQILNAGGTAVILPMGNTTVTLNSGISFGTLTNLPNNLIAFDGKGAPYTSTGSGGTVLSSTATVPLTSGGVTRTVSINPTTGLVSVS